MFEVGQTYINNNEYAGREVKTQSGHSFYCPKYFTVITDNGKICNTDVHSYTVIDDRGYKSIVDDDGYQCVTKKGCV